jgi:hypothetical protein
MAVGRRISNVRSVQMGSALVVAVLVVLAGAEAAPATSPLPPRPLVAYSCDARGGSLTVWRNGYATLRTAGPGDKAISRSFRVSPKRFRRLAATLAGARFHTLRPVYAPRNAPPLRLSECKVTYGKSTVVVLGAGIWGAAVPRRLQRVLDVLNAIVRANARA